MATTHSRPTTTARRRAQLVSDGVTASYLHELTRRPRRPASVHPVRPVRALAPRRERAPEPLAA